MRVRIFEKDIYLKDKGCNTDDEAGRDIPKSVNVFVKVTNACNAKCRFCSNANNSITTIEFDHFKFWNIIEELRSKNIRINRINITGGEPSIAADTVRAILKKADEYPDIHMHLNTNGLLSGSQELMRAKRWNSISVSIHHYAMDKLSEIYGARIPEKVLNFDGVDMSIVNGSCNLIQGYIDSLAEVEKMLKFAISIGLPRLGFVSLMPVNDFCKKRHIDFDDIPFGEIPHLYFTRCRNRGADCKCSNYLYNHDGKMLEVYMRNYANPEYCESSLMYDGQYLRQGFHNDNIIY
jgi:molybdenum cofactor biosynthesis enzyme MoaA